MVDELALDAGKGSALTQISAISTRYRSEENMQTQSQTHMKKETRQTMAKQTEQPKKQNKTKKQTLKE